jgi:hypothetical protein
MAVQITVPGASGTTVTQTYNAEANSAVALSIASTLNSILSSGNLTVTSVSGGLAVPPPSGAGNNELELTSSGNYVVPAGYAYVVDNTSGGPITVSGANNFIGGNGDINFTNSLGRFDTVLAGNGNDTFNLSGNYAAAVGNGNNRFNLSGSGQVSLGGGFNFVSITGGADTVFAGQNGVTGINGIHSSALTFYAANSTSPSLSVIVGGSGPNAVFGAGNSNILYADSSSSASGALFAGAGNETLNAAPSSGNDQLWGTFQNGANDVMWAGSGNDLLVAGAGGENALIGGSGSDSFFVVNKALINSQLTPGTDFIFNANSKDSFFLVGYDTLYGGTAGSGAAAAAVSTELSGSGTNTVTLKDGTQVTFAGGTNGIHFTST